MKILYDSQVFATQRYGGVSRIFHQLITRLSPKEELDIMLFHGFHINEFPLAEVKKQLFYYFGGKIPRLPYTAKLTRLLNTYWFDWFLPARKPGIFHPTDYSRSVYHWKTSPVVLTVYDMIPERFPEFFQDLGHFSRIKEKCIRRADKIIAISQSTKQDILNYYDIDESKIHVVYLGVPDSGVGNGTGVSWANTRFATPYILYVGTRKRGHKNFKTLLQAFASNKNLTEHAHLVCFGGGAFTKEETEAIAKQGCAGKVFQLTGDDDLLAELYKGAELFVYPSLYEGFGLPPLEAMTYNCPVTAAKAASIPEVLGDAALYFDPTDPASISSSMERLLLDRSYAEALIKIGASQAGKYSWSEMADQTLKVYKNLAI
ncbi:MAG: glycosyltransferase family 4 protein [bacterium]|nr:glycosyltransferase family 4 protein [bacterium]